MKSSQNFLLAYAFYLAKTLALGMCLPLILVSNLCFAQALPEDQMRAHFINVGQGNATLLEFSCGAILIDAGGEGPNTQAEVTRYLDRFFSRRTDLKRTLNSVIVTHPHVDHNRALKDVLRQFKVLNYIDNGLRNGSGDTSQIWAQDHAKSLKINYANYSYDQTSMVTGKKGITNKIIDPVNCSGVNPEITILSGRFQALPLGWTQSMSRKKGNLHSLVIKVVFGKSSFLFTGDLELQAMEKVVNLYKGTNMLDCDVWEVSHHGAYNGITPEWLAAVTPKFAIIPVGKWDTGIGTPEGSYNTYNYGHPRIKALEMLDQAIQGKRPPLEDVVAFDGIRDANRKVKVVKNIYASAWDGTIVMNADKDGGYTMLTPLVQ